MISGTGYFLLRDYVLFTGLYKHSRKTLRLRKLTGRPIHGTLQLYDPFSKLYDLGN